MVGLLRGKPSGSPSFANTLITIGLSFGVLVTSGVAIGARFVPFTNAAGVIVIVTVAVSHKLGVPLSQTLYLNLSVAGLWLANRP